ncbi:hypothetical protein EYC84_000022 [Monilinia fructicola]|uniref:Uncharacterized protein n=1 Tax=Monilinia fructicola TaxID=38448 RepID=A0A5M9JQD8_MONFR|nr:hypothetical protein EYC84_000022 [Monilinia fructicola]
MSTAIRGAEIGGGRADRNWDDDCCSRRNPRVRRRTRRPKPLNEPSSYALAAAAIESETALHETHNEPAPEIGEAAAAMHPAELQTPTPKPAFDYREHRKLERKPKRQGRPR